jgi:hypothetical protein
MPNSDLITEMMRQDPLVVIGFLLIGLSGWQSFVIYRRLSASGYKWRGYREAWPLIGTVPVAYLYLKARKENGWSAWPAYLIWISAIAGISALVVGLFRLSGYASSVRVARPADHSWLFSESPCLRGNN